MYIGVLKLDIFPKISPWIEREGVWQAPGYGSVSICDWIRAGVWQFHWHFHGNIPGNMAGQTQWVQFVFDLWGARRGKNRPNTGFWVDKNMTKLDFGSRECVKADEIKSMNGQEVLSLPDPAAANGFPEDSSLPRLPAPTIARRLKRHRSGDPQHHPRANRVHHLSGDTKPPPKTRGDVRLY